MSPEGTHPHLDHADVGGSILPSKLGEKVGRVCAMVDERLRSPLDIANPPSHTWVDHVAGGALPGARRSMASTLMFTSNFGSGNCALTTSWMAARTGSTGRM